MSDSGQVWTTEYMIARAEGIAAHWHKQLDANQVFELSRDILRFVEAQRQQDAQRIAQLEADNASLKAQYVEAEKQLGLMALLEIDNQRLVAQANSLKAQLQATQERQPVEAETFVQGVMSPEGEGIVFRHHMAGTEVSTTDFDVEDDSSLKQLLVFIPKEYWLCRRIARDEGGQ